MAADSRWSKESLAWLQQQALDLGFTFVGVALADCSTDAEGRDGHRFAEWVDAGHAGEMAYLQRQDESGQLLRSAIEVALPWARSVVICGLNYHAGGPLSIDDADSGAGWIGRYAWSGTQVPAEPQPESSSAKLQATDYHDVLLGRLRQLEAELQKMLPGESRCYVDTGPIVERAIAARAGVGWIGKNTTVINQSVGSWTLLGCIVTSITLDQGVVVMEAPDRCGTCTRCIDACPTDALIAPRQMDARRCIAYLTIEKKGVIDEDLRSGMGRQVFGCDICQDVCPWNRRAPLAADPEMIPRGELVNPDLEWLASLSSAEFRRWFKGSPLERTGKKRLQRNVALAMGNSGDPRFRKRLEGWKSAADPVLSEAAEWALGKLETATPS